MAKIRKTQAFINASTLCDSGKIDKKRYSVISRILKDAFKQDKETKIYRKDIVLSREEKKLFHR